jgi:hypothetical protein
LYRGELLENELPQKAQKSQEKMCVLRLLWQWKKPDGIRRRYATG